MTKKYDVYAIGNALMDMEHEVHDDFFKAQGIDKGLMTLVDEQRQNALLSALNGKLKKQQCGGSAANSIIANAQFGGKGFYSCKVASDPVGDLYFQDMQDNGIDSNLSVKVREEGVTGKCLVLITPDAERTMNTYLGVSSSLSVEEIVPEAIAQSKYMYMEGYLVASPTGKEAAVYARKIAEEHGVKTALTFSDVNMVKYFREGLMEMMGTRVDLLFTNESEAFAFTDTDNVMVAREKLKEFARTFVITRGENGAMIFDGDTFIDIEPYPVKAVDSNGAGDMFAGAFLYGITHGHTYASSGKLASLAASKVVSQFGPRLKWHEAQELKTLVFSTDA